MVRLFYSKLRQPNNLSNGISNSTIQEHIIRASHSALDVSQRRVDLEHVSKVLAALGSEAIVADTATKRAAMGAYESVALHVERRAQRTRWSEATC